MAPAARTLVILFADIGGSTALYERVGDERAHRLVSRSLAAMREAIQAAGGNLLRTVGDAALASFERADDAFEAACDMQRRHAGGALSIRVGFHLGSVIQDGGDVYGHAVNLAARIASFARPDEITATGRCVASLAPALQALATPLDRIAVRGVAEPVEVWRIDWLPADGPQTAIALGWQDMKASAPADAVLELALGARRWTLDEPAGRLVVGRAADCDVPVDSEHASRRHATIELGRGQFLLSDTSTNGTWLRRGGAHPVLVRRDTVVIDAHGELWLGVEPDTPDGTMLGYRVGATANGPAPERGGDRSADRGAGRPGARDGGAGDG